ncbi:SoxY-related AACIE arm protein [Piscinibacter sakaiensis]|uniref:SoxY-related AACIE arm protein n=1 Tax=Piscinibacter sakaiensis TaxID=1547922 RepID=UPI00372AF8E6
MKPLPNRSPHRPPEAGASAAPVRQARAAQAAILAWTGGTPPTPGRVRLDIAPLVDNGNAVPMTVQVDSPMTEADHVQAIAVFNEANPQREVIVATLAREAGVAVLATRIRLATSQQLVAVARMGDGRHWSGRADVIVTLAACLEG